jgi:hypothetical protein
MLNLNLNFIYYQPLDQFEIIFLGNIKNLYINNSLIYLIIVYLIIRISYSLILYDLRLIPYN